MKVIHTPQKQNAPNKRLKDKGDASDAIQAKWPKLKAFGGHAACGVIICPPTSDRSILDLIAPLLTWTLGVIWRKFT